ncbi:MAG: hypothetical protein MZV70_01690 [Desulfobacterales bacterium]|nr:hypothetical protein [Desulfobacterales bacterium]
MQDAGIQDDDIVKIANYEFVYYSDEIREAEEHERISYFLMIPGPTPVPESALLAVAKQPMIGHRSPEFSAILKEDFEDFKMALWNERRCVCFSRQAGTGAMEAAIFNLVNPGDKVLSLVMSRLW